MSNEAETIAAMNNEGNVSVYEINGTTYKVRSYFNPDCKETLADIVGRLINQDLDTTD